MTASLIWFKLGTMFTYKLHSRSMSKLFRFDQSSDQDIDFYQLFIFSSRDHFVTLLRSSPFNDDTSDSVQTRKDIYLWNTISIYGGIFRIWSICWSGYRFSWSCWLSRITRSGSRWPCIEKVSRCSISSEWPNFSYIFNVSISNGDQNIDFAIRASVTLFRSFALQWRCTDAVQTWNNAYLWNKFSIYGGIFWTQSVYRSWYWFSWSGRCRHILQGV